MEEKYLIVPEWPAPATVKARVTTRIGGVSAAPYNAFNLGTHVGDKVQDVMHNRMLLKRFIPADPSWLSQCHSICVVDAAKAPSKVCADASITTEAGVVCVVLTADCLPVLFCNDAGTVVGAAHAGWRGLAGGILEATIARMGVNPDDVMVWLGPAIGPDAFEVGDDVREAFVQQQVEAKVAFHPGAHSGKWMADLFMLAKLRLARMGIERVYGGGICTYTDTKRFYSYRRDRVTGRFASLIWLS